MMITYRLTISERIQELAKDKFNALKEGTKVHLQLRVADIVKGDSEDYDLKRYYCPRPTRLSALSRFQDSHICEVCDGYSAWRYRHEQARCPACTCVHYVFRYVNLWLRLSSSAGWWTLQASNDERMGTGKRIVRVTFCFVSPTAESIWRQ